MPVGSILTMIGRATELVDEGLAIYESVKRVVENGKETIAEDDLKEAKARLEASLHKARAASSRLDAAIAARLGE